MLQNETIRGMTANNALMRLLLTGQMSASLSLYLYHPGIPERQTATDVTSITYVTSSVLKPSPDLDVSPALRLGYGACSTIHHLHVDDLLHASLARCHCWAPRVVIFATTICALPIPFVVLGRLLVLVTVDVRFTRLDRGERNDTVAVCVLRCLGGVKGFDGRLE